MNEIMENNSLKEYYVKLLSMENNTVTMLEALKQSLSSSSSEVTATLVNESGVETTVRIPSFLYLENKLEQLENNFNNLFKMPESGEAWFSKESDMFKLKLEKTSSTPVKPIISTDSIYASIKDNNFLKDLVSPKTFLKMDISNLPDNIEKLFVRKIIIHNVTTFNSLQAAGLTTYSDYAAAVYNLIKGVDYDEYDTDIVLPTRYDTFVSQFNITEIPEIDSGNPWYDETSTASDGLNHLSYKLIVDTLEYSNQEDSSIVYTLKAGDKICLPGNLAVYKVKHVDKTDMSIIIEEIIGHVALQTFEENSSMYFSLYADAFTDFHYAEVPIEENQYVVVFLGTLYNNTRSILSDAYLADLSTIYMYDANGNKITDKNGNHMNYMDYYNTYCTNIGDLLLGLTEAIYPQLESYTSGVLYELQTGSAVKELVSNTFTTSNTEVLPINKHIADNTTTEEIINLNAQKAELKSQLSTLQSNIDEVYNTLVSSNANSDANSQLQTYYNKRTELQKQLNSVITNINIANSSVTTARANLKYHLRGITDITALENYLTQYADSKLHVVGLDVEYKYKSTTKDTTSATTINSNVFSDWNKQQNIDKERKLVFTETAASYSVEFEIYSADQNVVKWNQIDIPITQGEDVVVRIRYKYNVGQPFINLYTPWSEEKTWGFPAEYSETPEVIDILATNEQDAISAKFTETLSSGGYEEHVNNSIIQNNVKYYHMPDNIYSGFNTAENNYISLKDKLQSLDTNLNKTMELVNSEFNKKYSVLLVHDDITTTLNPSTTNKINIYNTDHISDSFIKNQMKIVIKNTGETPLKLYSIFPGNIDIPLLLDSEEFYEQYLIKYESIPLIVDGLATAQTLGQWIYFREDNPYTSEKIYLDSSIQELQDYNDAKANALDSVKCANVTFLSDNYYMKKNNTQTKLGIRKRASGVIETSSNTIIGLDFSKGYCEQLNDYSSSTTEKLETIYRNKNIDFFKYKNVNLSNNYLLRFEDICALNEKNEEVYLDSETSMSEYISTLTTNVKGLDKTTNTFIGAFLFPDIKGRTTILIGSNDNDYIEIPVGKSISLPITFEYFIDGETIKNITKSLYFDIRDSITGNPKHYMLELTANYDYTATGNTFNQSSLVDELVE